MGVSAEAPLILVLDQARWQRSQAVAVPAGMTLLFLPPDAPELQPAERLWPLSNEAICNQHFSDLQSLEEAQAGAVSNWLNKRI